MERIQFTIQFLEAKSHPLFIALSAVWKSEPVPLSPSAFLIFLYNHEPDLHPDDMALSYPLSRRLKSIKTPTDVVPGLVEDDDMAWFFNQSIDKNIEVSWQHKGQKQTITHTTPLPIKIDLKEDQGGVRCSRITPLPSDPFEEILFQSENGSIYFANGVLLQNPSDELLDFLESLSAKDTVNYPPSSATQFIQSIYVSHIDHLEWKTALNPADYLPNTDAPIPKLTLIYENNCLTPSLSYLYGSVEILPSDQRQSIVQPETGKPHERQPDMEQIYQHDLMELFEKYSLPFLLTSPGDIGSFLDKVVPTLKERSWQIVSEVKDFQVISEPVDLAFNFSSSSNINWFEFDSKCAIQGETFSYPEIARMMVENQGYIKTSKGFTKLSSDTQKSLDSLVKIGAFKPGKSFSKADMIPLLSEDQQIKASDEGASKLVSQSKSLQTLTHTEPGPKFKGTLRDYQQVGLNWLSFLHRNEFGGVLADDMGLGKTVQMLALASQILGSGPILVVGPTNVVYNWAQEIETFLPGQKVTLYTGQNRLAHAEKLFEQDFIITSFGILKNDIAVLNQIPFAGIFVDEAQAIKNPGTQLSKAMKTLQGPFRIAITGTPIENHIQDLWNIFDFAMPNYLGDASDYQKDMKEGDREYLKSRIKPFVLRREKREVLQSLPDKTEMILRCTMSSEQKALYTTILEAAQRGIRDQQGKNQQLNMLTALLKLRQVCTHPGILKEFKGQEMPSAKFDLLQETVIKLMDEDHKVVIFSQFTSFLDLIQDWVSTEDYPFERIDGSVSAKARIDAVNRFQNTSSRGVFLISLKAGGVGLNLTRASYVIHMDPWWNPAIESQATDRVHRMGQKNKVFVYKMITEDTVEEKVLTLQDSKKELLAEVIDIDSNTDKSISYNEIKSILFH